MRVISKDGSTAWYIGTPQFLLKNTMRWYGTSFFVMVRVRYVGTLFEFACETFYVQREAVNEDSYDRARRAHETCSYFNFF